MEIDRALILSDPQSDYGQYFLWRGLVQILGDENVVTFPFKKTYYGEVDNDYILPDGKKGFTSPYEFAEKRDKPRIWSLDDVVNKLYTFDLIILSSLRDYALLAYNDIKNKLGTIQCPLVYTDYEDYSGMNMWAIDKIKPDILFKREYLKGEPYPSHYPLYPLPFSSNIEPDMFPRTEKEYDVFFACGITHPIRQEIIDKIYDIVKRHNIKFIGGGNQFRRSWKEYNELMAKSKINIIARGWGWDTVRAWEAPAHDGMTMWYEHPQIIQHPFEDKIHTVYFNLDNFEEKLLYYLEHNDERDQIAYLGREHLYKHHTNRARAQEFLNTVKTVIGG